MNSNTFTLKRAAHLSTVLGACAAIFLTGCSSTAIPSSEYQSFTPMAPEKRVMGQVKLTWEVREDASAYCQERQASKGAITNGTHLACAVWSVAKQECRIVTGPQVDHVVLGHEVRHCFEGHFHL